MKLKQIHTGLLFALCAALAACSDAVMPQSSTSNEELTSEKTPIELTVGGVEGAATAETRANMDNPTDNPYNPVDKFDETLKTKVFMLMMSEYGTSDFGGSQETKYTVSRGDVDANSSSITFDTNNQKYWDDAHARSSQLTIYAFAQKVTSVNENWNSCTLRITNDKDETFHTNNTIPWQTDVVYPVITSWGTTNISNNSQDQNTIVFQDLLYSNNIADYSASSNLPEVQKTDRRLKFNFETRRFPTDNVMKFYHAMSKITIVIEEGDGFNTSSSQDFNFTTGNVKLVGFNTKGLFSIKYGNFQQITEKKEIPSICLKSTSGTNTKKYQLEALAIPNIDDYTTTTYPTHQNDEYSRFVSNKKDLATDVMMEFTIDNNKYQITSGQLYDALHDKSGAREKSNNGTYIPMDAGKNYVFTFTIGKTKVSNITAKVADWEEVTADVITPKNALVRLDVDDRGTAQMANVHFYRSVHTESTIPADPNAVFVYDWDKGYNKAASTEYVADHWQTGWYWENNKEFQHFRALMPSTTNTVATLNTESEKQYVSIISSNAENDTSYDVVAWGAPFKNKSSNKFYYNNTKGFDAISKDDSSTGDSEANHQIYKGIGATEDPIKILMFHMMSGVHFTIKTETGDATNKVELCHNNGGEPASYTRPTVQLVGYYPDGKVFMGNGLVTAAGTITTTSVDGIACQTTTTGANDQQEYYYSAIPQDLTNVKLYITTPDNNQYIVDLKDVKASSSHISSNNIANPYTQSDGKYKIDRWYPGFQYNYTFKLTKKGIDSIQATVVAWEDVEADDEEVQIK